MGKSSQRRGKFLLWRWQREVVVQTTWTSKLFLALGSRNGEEVIPDSY